MASRDRSNSGAGCARHPTVIKADWLEVAVDIALAPEVVPEGWVTTRQLCEMIGARRKISPTGRFARELSHRLTDGKPTRRFRVANGNRGVYPVIHYKLS
jgi:hypothetical protein